MQQLGSSSLTATKEAHDVYVHEGHLLEIQCGAGSLALHLRLQSFEMLRLNLTDQSEEQVLSVGALLDSQRHRGHRIGKLRAIRK